MERPCKYLPAFVRDGAPRTEHYETWLSPGHPALADKNDTRPLWARGSLINAVSYHYSLASLRDRSKAMTIRNPLGGGPYHDTPGGVTGRDF